MKRFLKSFRRDPRMFFNYERFPPFAVGAVFLGVVSSAVYQLLAILLADRNGAVTLSGVSIILAVAVLGFGGCAFWFGSKLMEPPTPVVIDESMPRPRKRRGLILLMSDRSDAVCRKAFQYHFEKLERCWLICSKESKQLADKLRTEFPKVCVNEPIVIANVFHPIGTYRAVKEIVEGRPAGWKRSDIIADYTGMTAHASVGMSLVGALFGCGLQYTPPKTFDDQSRPKEPDDPYEVRLVIRRPKRSEPPP